MRIQIQIMCMLMTATIIRTTASEKEFLTQPNEAEILPEFLQSTYVDINGK